MLYIYLQMLTSEEKTTVLFLKLPSDCQVLEKRLALLDSPHII